MTKLYGLSFELLPHSPDEPDLAPSDFHLFADFKKALTGKGFESNEKVIRATETYFAAKHKSFYKKGFEMLENRWMVFVLLKKTTRL